MQNYAMNTLTRLGSAFAFAALAGCSTMSTTTLKDDACMAGHEVKNELFLAFVFKAKTPEQYLISCREGKTAAQTTYIGQDDKGNLNPTGALFAVKYHQIVQDKIKEGTENGDQTTAKFYQDVSTFFGYFLKKIGGKTIDDIQSYVDELKKTPAPATPKPPPRCGTGNGAIRSCPSEPTALAPVVQ
jgi:hypothetical protein